MEMSFFAKPSLAFCIIWFSLDKDAKEFARKRFDDTRKNHNKPNDYPDEMLAYYDKMREDARESLESLTEDKTD